MPHTTNRLMEYFRECSAHTEALRLQNFPPTGWVYMQLPKEAHITRDDQGVRVSDPDAVPSYEPPDPPFPETRNDNRCACPREPERHRNFRKLERDMFVHQRPVPWGVGEWLSIAIVAGIGILFWGLIVAGVRALVGSLVG